VNAASSWVWGASGKHPVVKDYITIGGTPIMSGLSRWMEEGYRRVGRKTTSCSWRFFGRGPRMGDVACGLIRDSSDGAGRPFPLLIMGQGRLDGWEKVWEQLPRVLDDLWMRMEFLCSRRVFDLEELKRDIRSFPVPVLPGEHGRAAGTGVEFPVPSGKEGFFSFALTGADLQDEAVRLLTALKDHVQPVPEAVFAGGSLDESFLVAFARPLVVRDFETLWTMTDRDSGRP